MQRIPVDYLGILLAAGVVLGYYIFNGGVVSAAVGVAEQNPEAAWISASSLLVIFVVCYARFGTNWLLDSQSETHPPRIEEG